MPRPKPRGRRAAFMDQDLPNYFAGPYLERRAEAREDPEWLAAARADPETIYLIGRGTAQLLHTGPPPRIAFLGHDAPLVRGAGDDGLVLLGWFRGARCLLADLRAGHAADPPAGTSFEELRPLAPLLGTEESGLLARAPPPLRRVRRAHDRDARRTHPELHQHRLRPGALPAPRSGHHRAGERRRAGAARTSAELAAAALLDHRRLRRARREPRGCGDPRGGRGDRRGGDGRPL